MNNFCQDLVNRFGNDRMALIPILQQIQKRYRYLPPEIFTVLPKITSITTAEISSVVTFYNGFRLQPAGKYSIKVCIGTACHVKGAGKVFQAFKDYLNIPADADTDANKQFTVSEVACLGCCMLAVAVQIDDIIYGWVEPQNVGQVIDEFLANKKHEELETKSQVRKSVKGEIRLCCCSSCSASGSEKIKTELNECINRLHLPAKVKEVGCTGMSYLAPLIEIILSDGRSYNYASMAIDAVEPVLLEHFQPVSMKQKMQLRFTRFAEKILSNEASKTVFRHHISSHTVVDEDAYFHDQIRLATDASGEVEPTNFSVYQNGRGFIALAKTFSMSPQQTVDELLASGLRGRGGGGFLTGQKWQQVLNQDSREKYIICNADEGDPGAFMDRMLLESFPFRIIEGIVIAAKTVGASKGFIYVREEYPLAVKRLQKAIDECLYQGVLGENILTKDFSFELKIVEGAGAFVCGEETALIASLEGKRGTPTFRPPYPTEVGYKNKPTLINNVETFALIPWIIENGAEAFAKFGTDNSKGTKTFALAGNVKRGGLIEIPMGMTINEIVNNIGGGVTDDKALKAVQIGGPSGGCIPAKLADLPVDFEALQKSSAIMGSGGLVVLSEDDCMVDIAKYFLEFTRIESCGKCTCCRTGTVLMNDILEKFCAGTAKESDLIKLETIGKQMQVGSLCGLGKSAPNPVLSTITHFRDEYLAHIEGRCPAGKCSELITFSISDLCIGCTVCSQKCPVEAIDFSPYERHEIDQEKCVKCGVCKTVCPQNAVEVK